MPTIYHDPIEILHGLTLDGTMTADAYEVIEPDPNTPNLIRSNQDWAIKVKWEIRGVISHLLDGEWRIQALLERIGKDTPAASDYDLPVVTVAYETGDYVQQDHQMKWEADVKIQKGVVVPGAYKLVTLLQLFDENQPTPIAGLDEQRGIINIFNQG